jgi:DNA-binding transcriptional LysR family regulator
MNELQQLRRIDLNLLVIFASVARHRKLSAAADELGLTKSAISHALTRLRYVFADELFLRRQNGVQMTPRAITLWPKIASIIALTTDVLRSEQKFNPELDRREIRLGTVEYTTSLFGPPLCRILEREAPNMRLAVVSMRRPELLQQVSSYQVDVGIGSFIGEVGDLVTESLYEDQYVVMCRKAHPTIGARLSEKQYLDAKHIIIVSEGQPQIVLQTMLSTVGAARKEFVKMPLYLAAMGAASETDQLLTVPKRLAQHFARRFGLRVHKLPFAPVRQTISLISHAAVQHDAPPLWFISKIKEVARMIDRGR